jgi:hypothetical protein
MFASIAKVSKRNFALSFREIAPRLAFVALSLFVAACAARRPPPAPATVPIPTAPPRIEPPNVIGISPDTLKTRLGVPAFSRKDGATEMWRYDASACHAFFFFTGGKVSHVETIPRGPDNAADPGCLSAVKKAS